MVKIIFLSSYLTFFGRLESLWWHDPGSDPNQAYVQGETSHRVGFILIFFQLYDRIALELSKSNSIQRHPTGFFTNMNLELEGTEQLQSTVTAPWISPPLHCMLVRFLAFSSCRRATCPTRVPRCRPPTPFNRSLARCHAERGRKVTLSPTGKCRIRIVVIVSLSPYFTGAGFYRKFCWLHKWLEFWPEFFQKARNEISHKLLLDSRM